MMKAPELQCEALEIPFDQSRRSPLLKPWCFIFGHRWGNSTITNEIRFDTRCQRCTKTITRFGSGLETIQLGENRADYLQMNIAKRVLGC